MLSNDEQWCGAENMVIDDLVALDPRGNPRLEILLCGIGASDQTFARGTTCG
jgi:hypothetical protein